MHRPRHPDSATAGRKCPSFASARAAVELALRLILFCLGGFATAAEIPWDRDWRFHLGDAAGAEAPAFVDADWRTLDLPHDWSIEGKTSAEEPSAGGGGFFPTGIGWYRKSFKVLPDWRDQQIEIEFDGIYRNSEVWINGHSLGRRPSGFSALRYDLTPHLRADGDNVIAVRVDNSAQPNSRWYTGSGIYRHVRLRVNEPVHLEADSFHTTTTSITAGEAEVRFSAEVSNTLSSFPFRYDYYGPKGRNRAQPLDEAAGITGFTVSPENYFGERAIPLGFDENPDVLYYASNVGRDTYGVYSVNLATKERGHVKIENPTYDLIGPPASGFPGRETLVFDRYSHQLAGVRYESVVRSTAWLRPELQELQTRFEKTFPGRCVTILDWDQRGNRYVVSTEGVADPGAYYVYDRTTDKLSEFVRRAPWVEEKHIHTTLSFGFSTADGARITGLITFPRQPRLRPVPMIVVCPDLPWLRVRSEFQSEVQAHAGMGFAVVQLNGRGAWGLGLKQRQTLTSGYDLVQVADIATTVESLGQAFKVNVKRVALFGRGHGGFIALRALQEHPDMFRCAVAIEAPVNLADWLEEQRWTTGEAQPQLTRAWLGDAARLQAAPLVRGPERLTKPILMLNYPGPKGGDRRTAFVKARGFASAVKSRGGDVTFDALDTDYLRGLPAGRAAVFDQVEQFLNTHIYDFKVRVPDLQIIK